MLTLLIACTSSEAELKTQKTVITEQTHQLSTPEISVGKVEKITRPFIIPDISDIPAYKRADWPQWIDADSDCQNARAEVLIDESMITPTFRSNNKCTVDTGQWLDEFTGKILTEASDLDVDHMVPLKNAHDSGGWAWAQSKKKEFANDISDPNHLIAVSAGVNRSKGAKTPDQWKPPLQSYWCTYAVNWISIKNRWDLGVTYSEWSALEVMLTYCDKEITITQSQIQSTPTVIATVEVIRLPIGKRTMKPIRFDPSGPDRDCGDFSSWEEAQDFYEVAGGNNAHRLDSDRDGVACQNLR